MVSSVDDFINVDEITTSGTEVEVSLSSVVTGKGLYAVLPSSLFEVTIWKIFKSVTALSCILTKK